MFEKITIVHTIQSHKHVFKHMKNAKPKKKKNQNRNNQTVKRRIIARYKYICKITNLDCFNWNTE